MHSHRRWYDRCHQIIMVVASWSITLTSSSSNFFLPSAHTFHPFIEKGITQFYHFSSLSIMKFLSILKVYILKFPCFLLEALLWYFLIFMLWFLFCAHCVMWLLCLDVVRYDSFALWLLGNIWLHWWVVIF
jgi:hypothetical protein